MKWKFAFAVLLNSALISFIANSFLIVRQLPSLLFAIVPAFLLVNIFAGVLLAETKSKKLKICQHGTVLLYAFYISLIVSFAHQIPLAFRTIPNDYMTFVWSVVLCVCVNFVVFWNGIICVYLTSTQLGIKLRLIGVLCGLIPLVNLVVLFFIIKSTTGECFFETKKEKINERRKNEKLCKTKYPVLLVHGVFFRDSKVFNYWGRIPKELEQNGATIFYGKHPAAASIADCAESIKKRIEEITTQTGAEKVNIIAHSKGGLDCRYALSKLGVSDRVASLTTVNTPHTGCLFADYLLTKIPTDIQNKIAKTYNTALEKLGEENPDFMAAVTDLTDAHCGALNAEMPVPEGVYCQSVGSVIAKASGGRFPLNFSYYLVKHFSGENDGLVSESAFKWGEKYTLLRPTKRNGISHADIIDLNRANIQGFDVREFYVDLVNDLKNRGF